MWPWWVKIPIEDLTDVTLAIDDTEEDEEDEDIRDKKARKCDIRDKKKNSVILQHYQIRNKKVRKALSNIIKIIRISVKFCHWNP